MLKKATAFLLIAGTAFLCYAQTTDTPPGIVEIAKGGNPAKYCTEGCMIIQLDKKDQLDIFWDTVANEGQQAGEAAAKKYLKDDKKFCPLDAKWN